MIGGSFVVIAAIVALAVDQWWILVGAFVVLIVVLAAMIATVLRMTSNQERPSPITVAALEEDGVGDPERHFSELVKEFTPEPSSDGEHRTTAAAEDEPASATAEQRTRSPPVAAHQKPWGPGTDQERHRSSRIARRTASALPCRDCRLTSRPKRRRSGQLVAAAATKENRIASPTYASIGERWVVLPMSQPQFARTVGSPGLLLGVNQD
jgi:hypothetical protein